MSWERKAGWCNSCLSNLLVKSYSVSQLYVAPNPPPPPPPRLAYMGFPGSPCYRTPDPADGRRELRSWGKEPGISFNLPCEQKEDILVLACNLKQPCTIVSQSVFPGCTNKDGPESHVSDHCNENSLSRVLVPSACKPSYCSLLFIPPC